MTFNNDMWSLHVLDGTWAPEVDNWGGLNWVPAMHMVLPAVVLRLIPGLLYIYVANEPFSTYIAFAYVCI